MDEQEKARRLTKAIDDLLQGQEPDLDDEELRELLEIARLRGAAAGAAGSLAEKYQTFVWDRVEARIRQRLGKHGPKSNPGANDPRKMSLPLSQPSHQERQEAEKLERMIDLLILGEPIWEAEDSQLRSLAQVARIRYALSKALTDSAAPYEKRVWDRLTAEARGQARPRRRGLSWPRLAAAAAALALITLAVGPLPATGLADHPVARLVSFLRHQITSVEAPPPVPPLTETVHGIDVTIAEAQLTGLPVREPTYLPPGFRRVTSMYFPQAITAPAGGLWDLAHTDGEGRSLIV